MKELLNCSKYKQNNKLIESKIALTKQNLQLAYVRKNENKKLMKLMNMEITDLKKNEGKCHFKNYALFYVYVAGSLKN